MSWGVLCYGVEWRHDLLVRQFRVCELLEF